MTMLETEQSIRADLDMLGDGLSRMEYLLGCAREDPGIPEEERRKEDLVADCQMNTWLMVRWEGDVLTLRTDSESLLVKGALSLIAEIYSGRSRQEIADFTCTLLLDESFAALFNAEQKKGLQNVLNTLKGGASP
ncbi:MAG: SufE family protein [Oscillospiraceae bacterium]